MSLRKLFGGINLKKLFRKNNGSNLDVFTVRLNGNGDYAHIPFPQDILKQDPDNKYFDRLKQVNIDYLNKSPSSDYWVSNHKVGK